MSATVIEAGKAEKAYWRDLWRYRELFAFLAWRDVLVRYKQTAVGAAWAILQPLLTMLVFSFIFGRLAGLPSGGAPYPVLVFAAMLPWQFFANALSTSSASLVSNAQLVSKVYFPRMIIPGSSMVVSLVDFAISFSILAVLMLFYGIMPSLRFLALPGLILLAMIPAIGAGLFVSSLNVRFRDFRYVVPFMVQFGLYISPVGFSSDVIPEQWRLLYSINPMVGVIDGFRWAIIGNAQIHLPGFLLSVGLSLGLLALGIWQFRRTERRFADII